MNKVRIIFAIQLLLLLSACNSQYQVIFNGNTLYDPTLGSADVHVEDPDLQGCINFALLQQNLQSATQLMVLSCPTGDIITLAGIEQLSQLRFLNISNNRISRLNGLERLSNLSGLSLPNNAIDDIGPLLKSKSLLSVNLQDNDDIPCDQLNRLEQTLGDKLTSPENCES